MAIFLVEHYIKQSKNGFLQFLKTFHTLTYLNVKDLICWCHLLGPLLQEWAALLAGFIQYQRWWNRTRWKLLNATYQSSRLQHFSVQCVHRMHWPDTTIHLVNIFPVYVTHRTTCRPASYLNFILFCICIFFVFPQYMLLQYQCHTHHTKLPFVCI